MNAGKNSQSRDSLRAVKREITGSTRCIEKEITGLQKEEKNLIMEIRRTAKLHNEVAVRVLARELVRLRKQISKFQATRAQMRGIATHTQAMYATTSVAAGMKGVNRSMTAMTKQLAPKEQMRVTQEFQRRSQQMAMTTEMMSDSIDDALDNEDVELDSDDLTNQVLDEIGISVASQLPATPKQRIAKKTAEANSSSETEDL